MEDKIYAILSHKSGNFQLHRIHTTYIQDTVGYLQRIQHTYGIQ